MKEEDQEEKALADFSSAEWRASRAAGRYSELVIERVRSALEEEAKDPRREDEEVSDILWEIVDGLDAVIYTHRARAVVIGEGEDETREAFEAEMGKETPATWEDLAAYAIRLQCAETVSELEEEREDQEVAQ